VSRLRSDPPKRNLLKFPKLHRTSKQPEQQQPKATMEMSMVYKAMPCDIFEDILTRFKRRQTHKLDCMQTYMESSERDNWCDYTTLYVRTNDDIDGQEYELAKIERKLGYLHG
jgi:hypothetical protein